MSYSIAVYADWDRDGSYTGPLTTNRITNGNFADGETGWSFWSDIVHSVSGGKLHAYRNGAGASFYQDLSYLTRAGDIFQVSFKVANTSAGNKDIKVTLHSTTGEGSLDQLYTILAGAAEETKTYTVTATAAFTVTRFEIYVDTDDNLADLTFDDISVTTIHNWDVITPYVIGGSYQIGFSGERRHVADIGQCFLEVDNGDKRFSPANTTGPLYRKLMACPVRLTGTDGVTTWNLFTGFITAIRPAAGKEGSRRALITCEDLLSQFQRAQDFSILPTDETRADELIEIIGAITNGNQPGTYRIQAVKQPSAGNVISFSTRNHGELSYTFKASLTTAGDVLIGATKEDSLQNLADAINADPDTAGVAYHADTEAVVEATAWKVAAGTPLAGGTVTITGSGNNQPLGPGTDYLVAQRVRPTEGLISSFKATLGPNTGSPTGTLTYKITPYDPATRHDELPYLNISGTFSPTASAENTIAIAEADQVVCDGATDYWIVLHPTVAQSAGNNWTWQTSTTSTYTGGEVTYYNGVDYTVDTDKDAACALITSAVTPANLDYSHVMGGFATTDLDSGLTAKWGVDGGTVTARSTYSPSSLQQGERKFTFSGDTWGAATNGYTALMEVAQSEMGYLWLDGTGTLTFKNRYWEVGLGAATPVATLVDAGTDLSGAMSDQRLVNHCNVTYVPRDQIGSGTVALSLSPIEVPGHSFMGATVQWPRNNRVIGYAGGRSSAAGQPGAGDKVLLLSYTDEAGIAIGARDVILPVPGTDYTTNDERDGSGFNYTFAQAHISISMIQSGSGVELSFKNPARGPLYVRNLKVRGTQIYHYSPETVTVTDRASIEDYGPRPADVELAFGSGAVFAEAIGYYYLYRYSQPLYAPDTLIFEGPDLAGTAALLGLKIGDVLTLTETQSAVSGEKYAVRSIGVDASEGGAVVNVRLGLKLLEAHPFVLGTSALDGSDVIGL